MRALAIAGAVVMMSACGSVSGDADAGAGDDDDDGGGGVVDAANPADAPVADATPDAMVDPCLADDVDHATSFDCLARAACSLLQRCLGGTLDVDECATSNSIEIFDTHPDVVNRLLFAEAIASGTMSFHPDRLAACLDTLASAECSDLFGEGSPIEACGVYTGNVGAGGSCFISLECAAAGAECQFADFTCEEAVCCAGTCVFPVPLGGDCTGAFCGPGAHCVNDVCRTGETGALCNFSFQCDDAFFCRDGACTPDFTDGQSCTDDQECLPPLQCLGDDLPAGVGTCGPSSELGDRCDQTLCGLRYVCDQPDTDALGTCAEVPAAGEPCFGGNFCGFITGGFCNDGGLCEAFRGEGDACTGNNECGPLRFCTNDATGEADGVCSSGLDDGSVCTDDSHCLSGICNAGGVCEAYMACF